MSWLSSVVRGRGGEANLFVRSLLLRFRDSISFGAAPVIRMLLFGDDPASTGVLMSWMHAEDATGLVKKWQNLNGNENFAMAA